MVQYLNIMEFILYLWLSLSLFLNSVAFRQNLK